MDRVANFLGEKTPRRVVALASFVGLLHLFRHLAVLLVFFVTFERSLGFGSRLLARRTGLSRKGCVGVLVSAFAVVVVGLAWLGIAKSVRTVAAMESSIPERLAELRDNPLVTRVNEHVGGTERITAGLKHYAGSAMGAASAVGHFFVYVIIGFILALVYVLEEEELASFWARVDARSLFGTLGRWLGHVADAAVVTVQLQLVVAACNTLLTLPVLLVIGVPHVPGLMILIFVSALVPVIGNAVSGVVLSLFAYQASGWIGVGTFVGLTFVLHKVESYYLSPRLTARHVKIPGFLLIVSLLLCEHLFGFVGLFLSFPLLFVAGRIRQEWLEEDAGAAGSPLVLNDSPDVLATRGPPDAPTALEIDPLGLHARAGSKSVQPVVK